MKSAWTRPAARRLDPRALGEAEVAALADDAHAQLGGVDADRVARAVHRVGVGLVEALTTVPIPPFHSRSTGARRTARIRSVGASSVSSTPSAARVSATAGSTSPRAGRRRRPRRSCRGRSRPRSSSRPARARTAACARQSHRRIGIGIDEHVAVVVGGDEADLLGQQHPVAEHVTGHVADAHDRERRRLGVEAELAEVALDRLPRTLGGDPQRLVVIARRAAGGERVAQPEAAALGDLVGGVRERRGALVGGDDEVRVLPVEHADVGRMHDLAVDEVVGDVEQRLDELLVAGLDRVAQRRPPAGGLRSRKPPFAPAGTITAFLVICARIRPKTSVR